MARTVDDRRANQLCAYYTHSDPIRDFMISRLALRDGLSILEPASGDGAFVDALVQTGLALNICCLDKNHAAIEELSQKYQTKIKTLCVDTILDSLAGIDGCLRKAGLPERFDRIVGNPPYGGWLNYETRATLKKAFPGFHVRETYSLFILRCLGLLAPNGILSFIVPDTFLTVGSHRPLRKLLAETTEILEIVTLPSKLFPGVAFGYANLCIISLRRPEKLPDPRHEIRLVPVSMSSELSAFARGDLDGCGSAVLQRSILQRVDLRIWTAPETQLESILDSAKLRLGDVAECKTGIYTGNNKRFIRAIDGSSVRGSYYLSLPECDLRSRELNDTERRYGIPNSPAWIPIVKGGSHRFVQNTSWAIDWSDLTISLYHSDGKARFQNSAFYFRKGIGVPMVTSHRINAFLTEGRVFDQSVVGIFPKDRTWLLALLVILNSPIATRLLKEGINSTANNSANYLKRLPLPFLSFSELRHLTAIGRLIVTKKRRGLSTESDEREAGELVAQFYQRVDFSTTQDAWSTPTGSDENAPISRLTPLESALPFGEIGRCAFQVSVSTVVTELSSGTGPSSR